MADRTSGPSGNFYTRWRKRRRAVREARHLIKEARRILRKYSYRIKEETADEVVKAIGALREGLAGKHFGTIRERLERLDELVDKHLGFGRKSAIREYAESIGVAVLVALLLRAFVVEAFKIPSGSMEDTLLIGDHILKLANLCQAFPKSGDHGQTGRLDMTFGDIRQGGNEKSLAPHLDHNLVDIDPERGAVSPNPRDILDKHRRPFKNGRKKELPHPEILRFVPVERPATSAKKLFRFFVAKHLEHARIDVGDPSPLGDKDTGAGVA